MFSGPKYLKKIILGNCGHFGCKLGVQQFVKKIAILLISDQIQNISKNTIQILWKQTIKMPMYNVNNINMFRNVNGNLDNTHYLLKKSIFIDRKQLIIRNCNIRYLTEIQ